MFVSLLCINTLLVSAKRNTHNEGARYIIDNNEGARYIIDIID